MFTKIKYWFINIIDKLSLLLIWFFYATKELLWWAECKFDGDIWFSEHRPTIGECFDEADNKLEEFIGKK